jgi:nucleoid DNA-binding protein
MNKKINKHISYLLCEHNCVIIPDFGGFIANYQSARIESDSHLIHPAKKAIVFNKSLQNNDGLLVNEVAVCEGLTFKQSEKEIAKYVEYLKDSLHLHKKIFIDEIGTLLQTSDNTILFIQSNTKNHLLSSYGFYTLQFPAIERTSVQEKFEEKIKQIPKEKLPSNRNSWLKVAAVLLPLATLTFFSINESPKWQKEYASLIPFSSSSSELEPTTYSKASYNINSPASNIESAVIVCHSLINKNAEIDNVIDSKHFIVAGAFSSKKNANKLVAKLKRWDYQDAKIIGKNKSGLYRVCYSEFTQSNDALASLRNIKKSNPSAWLLSIN